MLEFFISSFILVFSFFLSYPVFKKASIIESSQALPKWRSRLHDISSNHTQVSGILSGFSITVVVLIAGGRLSSGQQNLSKVIEELDLGLFGVSFYGYVATGILFSLVIEHEEEMQYYLFSIASILYFFSVVLSFIALFTLVVLLKYDLFRITSLFMIFGAIFGGFFAVGIPLLKLFRIKLKILLLTLLNAVVLANFLWNLRALVPSILDVRFITSIMLPSLAIVISLIFGMCMMTFLPRKKDGNRKVNSLEKFAIQQLWSLYFITTLSFYLVILIFQIKN